MCSCNSFGSQLGQRRLALQLLLKVLALFRELCSWLVAGTTKTVLAKRKVRMAGAAAHLSLQFRLEVLSSFRLALFLAHCNAIPQVRRGTL